MKKIRRILMLASVCLIVGITIAYYNTSSLGYDDANILSYNNESLEIFDIHINYNDIKQSVKKMKKHIPSQNITI